MIANQRNIIVILNDDHGQWAMGAYGNREIRTPTLDHLARTGVLMENAFTPTPVCSTARACFYTGRLASQHGVHDYISNETQFFERDWLGNEVTLPELLRDTGYQTALCGKWHLGNDSVAQHGFEYWSSLSGDYPIDAKSAHRYSIGGQMQLIQGYKSQVITDHAISFLRQREPRRPFFLFIGHTATHSPWADHPERLVESYRQCRFDDIPRYPAYPFGRQALESVEFADRRHGRESLAQYYAAVTTLDEATGRLLDELEAQNLADKTLVVYTSDHGLCCGHHGIWGKGNGTMPLNMVEESIRIPLIFNHPDGIFGGQRRAEPVDHLDVFQTLLAFAGVPCPARGPDYYPGRSFLPMITNGDLPSPWRDTQFAEFGDVRMIRTRRHKLVTRQGSGAVQLFDLADDPAESVNLAGEPEHANLVTRLTVALDTHFGRYESLEHSGRRPGGPEPTNLSSPWARVQHE